MLAKEEAHACRAPCVNCAPCRVCALSSFERGDGVDNALFCNNSVTSLIHSHERLESDQHQPEKRRHTFTADGAGAIPLALRTACSNGDANVRIEVL